MDNKIVKLLDSKVNIALSAQKLEGFEKAYTIAEATKELKKALTTEYMKPIMELQNTGLGFKTDKSKEGYPEPVVKECLIEAVLKGLQPVNNQFNIIAGNMYPTREGFTYLLRKVPGLVYDVIPKLPRIANDKSSADISVIITWSIDGKEEKTKELEFTIRMNQYMTADAVIGKAHRKARAWLYNSLTDSELADADADEIRDEIKSDMQDKSKNITSSVSDALKKESQIIDPDNFDISELPKEGKREWPDYANVMECFEFLGLDDSNYKQATTELVQIEKNYPDIETLANHATKEEIEKVINKFKKIK